MVAPDAPQGPGGAPPGAFETIAALIDGAQPFGPWVPPEAVPPVRGSDWREKSLWPGEAGQADRTSLHSSR